MRRPPHRRLLLAAVFFAFVAGGLWTTAIRRTTAALDRGDLTTAAAIQDRLAWFRLDDADQRYALAGALIDAGRLDDAVAQFQRGLALAPTGELWAAFAALQVRRGDPEAAIDAWQRGFEVNHDPSYLHRASKLVLKRGETERAFDFSERAHLVNPPSAKVHGRIAGMAGIMGLRKQQIHHLRAALEFEPAHSGLRRSLAWLLATSENAQLRDGAEAVRLAEALASETGRRDASVLDILAAALASDGRFDAAVVVSAEALDRAARNGEKDLATGIRERLALYRSGRAYFEIAPVTAHG